MEDREVQGLEVQIEASVDRASFDRAERRIEELSRDVNVNVGARSFFSRASNISRNARQFSARASRGFMGYMNSMSDGFFGYLRRNRRNAPYANSPFRRLVSDLGSTMLITYATGMAARGVMGAMNTVANTEVESLKGRAYRDSLSDPTNFNVATDRLSSLTGQAKFQSRARLATLYDRLNRSGVSTSSFSPDELVETLRGIQIISGETTEQVDKKLFDLLTGRASEEDKKEYGVVSRDNPTKILKEIYKTLKENSIASIGMSGTLLQDDIQTIINAPKNMLEKIRMIDNDIFKDSIDIIKKNVEGFFGIGDDETSGRWIVFAKTVSETLKTVLGEDLGKNIANTVVTDLSRTLATVKESVDFIKKKDIDTGGKIGNIVGSAASTGFKVLLGAASVGTAINFGKIFWKYSGLSTAFEIFKNIGGLDMAKLGFNMLKTLPKELLNLPKTYWELGKNALTYGKDIFANIGLMARLGANNILETGRTVIGNVNNTARAAMASVAPRGAGFMPYASRFAKFGIPAATFFGLYTTTDPHEFDYHMNNRQQTPIEIYKKDEFDLATGISQQQSSQLQQNSGNTIIHANNIYMDKDGMEMDTMMNGGGL